MTETNAIPPVGQDCGQWATPAVAGLGDRDFHTALLLALRETVAADHLSHVCYGQNGAVRYSSAASLLNPSLIEWTTRVFVDQMFYRRDPNYGLLCDLAGHSGQPRTMIVKPTAPSAILDAEYRHLLFEQPGFASKISLIGAHDDGIDYINLYFSRQHCASMIEVLQQRAPLMLALAQRHWQLCCTVPADACADALSWYDGLSLRERQVADLLRQGYTAKQVGRCLNLSPTTVITYKHRIFKKNQVGSLKEFLIRAPALP